MWHWRLLWVYISLWCSQYKPSYCLDFHVEFLSNIPWRSYCSYFGSYPNWIKPTVHQMLDVQSLKILKLLILYPKVLKLMYFYSKVMEMVIKFLTLWFKAFEFVIKVFDLIAYFYQFMVFVTLHWSFWIWGQILFKRESMM